MITIISTLNEIITAGIAVTAFSLLLYALAFNLRDRVARSFALMMVVFVVIYSADAVATSSQRPQIVNFLHAIQWIGIIWLPASYTRLSKALLSATGIRVKRIAYWYSFVISFLFTVYLIGGLVMGELSESVLLMLQKHPSVWSLCFAAYYIFSVLLGLYNVIRARNRTKTTAMQRRMVYLLIGCAAPAVGAFPYMLYGSSMTANSPLFFLLVSFLLNILTGIFIVLMAYSVAFFGVSYPDRVVKNRLMRWLMRGPVTAVVTLGVVTITRRIGAIYGISYNAFVPFNMIITILLLEYTITLFGNKIQHWLLFGANNSDLLELEILQDRLVTEADLQQFLEMTLAAIRELTRAESAFIAAVDGVDLKYIALSGEPHHQEEQNHLKATLSHLPDLLAGFKSKPFSPQISQEEYTLIPVYSVSAAVNGNSSAAEQRQEQRDLIGMVGVQHVDLDSLQEDQDTSLSLLLERISMALQDRRAQISLFRTLRSLRPELDRLQEIRAAGRFDTEAVLAEVESEQDDGEMAKWVKDALTHYWGGPRLNNTPLVNLRIVQQAKTENDTSTANALRSVLRDGIDKMKPEGAPRLTSEWLLYNILQFKFLDGKKVREISAQLSISEADFYRKQRVAIGELTRQLLIMEAEAAAQPK